MVKLFPTPSNDPKTNAVLQSRVFQLWEYRVSHGSLLIRSPIESNGDISFSSNVDMIFVGVEYIGAPRFLGSITIDQATDGELTTLSEQLGKNLAISSVWILQNDKCRFAIVAAGLQVTEHSRDIFDSPFALSRR